VSGIERELRNLTLAGGSSSRKQVNVITNRVVCGAMVAEYCMVVLTIRRPRWAVALRMLKKQQVACPRQGLKLKLHAITHASSSQKFREIYVY